MKSSKALAHLAELADLPAHPSAAESTIGGSAAHFVNSIQERAGGGLAIGECGQSAASKGHALQLVACQPSSQCHWRPERQEDPTDKGAASWHGEEPHQARRRKCSRWIRCAAPRSRQPRWSLHRQELRGPPSPGCQRDPSPRLEHPNQQRTASQQLSRRPRLHRREPQQHEQPKQQERTAPKEQGPPRTAASVFAPCLGNPREHPKRPAAARQETDGQPKEKQKVLQD